MKVQTLLNHVTQHPLRHVADESVLSHTFKPRTVKLHLCEYNPETDRHPYLSFTQRLLRAAGAANLTEIWLDAVEAKRLGLSYESCAYPQLYFTHLRTDTYAQHFCIWRCSSRLRQQ